MSDNNSPENSSDNTEPEIKPTPTINTIPSWFKIVAVVALVWNLLGVMAFVGQMMMTPEMVAELPQAEQDL